MSGIGHLCVCSGCSVGGRCSTSLQVVAEICWTGCPGSSTSNFGFSGRGLVNPGVQTILRGQDLSGRSDKDISRASVQ